MKKKAFDLGGEVTSFKISTSRQVIRVWRFLFLRKILFKVNKFIYFLSLKSIGIMNYESDFLTGEKFLVDSLSGYFNCLEKPVVIDVGANIGSYSDKVRSVSKNASIYAFEPHPKTFDILKISAEQHSYFAFSMACSDIEGVSQLYDYSNQNTQSGSAHASLHKDTIETVHHSESESWDVAVTTLDKFVDEYKIDKINLLKIDTEGNELKVIMGAQKCIESNSIDIIQIEFTQLNIVSRVFLKDIYNLLKNYSFFRMLPDGLVSLGEYNPIHWEIFAYQNIIAINKDKIPHLKRYLHI
jgi:FkbM family methyltransferase